MSENKHTPEPWATNGEEVFSEEIGNEYGYQIAVVAHEVSDFTAYVIAANARRIVACINACAGIETSLLEEFPSGINGLSNIAIGKQRDEIKKQRDNAWSELRAIREAIKANPDESTLDEVRRVVGQRDEMLNAAKTVVERFMPCRENYIFSKRAALDRLQAAIASVEGGAEPCPHHNELLHQTGDGDIVWFCPDCGRNRPEGGAT